MAVRPSESRLPEGVTPESLGFHTGNGDVMLFSFLPEQIRLGANKNFLQNKYVVFVTQDPLPYPGNQIANDQITYEWQVILEATDGTEILSQSYPLTEIGVFHLDSQDWTPLPTFTDISRISVTVRLLNASHNEVISFSLFHTVVGENQFLEDLLTADDALSLMGDPHTTRLVGNDLADYLLESSTYLNGYDQGLPENLTAAIVYLSLLKSGSIFQAENPFLEEYLNSENPVEPFFEEFAPTGICSLKPHFLNLFFHPPPLSNDPILPAPFTFTDQEAFSDFRNLDHPVDLYNVLRFPKSAMKICTALLAGLKARHPQFAGLMSSQDLQSDNGCVKTIVSELSIGPLADPPEFTALGKRIFDIAWSPYIQALFQGLVYETITIRVLDVRSGRPIQDAKVQRITIAHSDNFVNEEQITKSYLYFGDPIVGNNLVQQVQQVFNHDLIAPEQPLNANGNWNARTRDKYNEYWQSRVLDNSLEHASDTVSPADYLLRYIVEEHNGLMSTNLNGDLHVRIPRPLLENRRLAIHIGFHEFAIVVEKLKNNNSINRTFGPIPAVGIFHVRWIGDTPGNGQSTNWDDSIANAANFGWNAADEFGNNANLKVAQSLLVKDNLAPFGQFNVDLFSEHFGENSHSPHFILFGMQWCQPLFDEISDPDPSINIYQRVNRKTFVQRTNPEIYQGWVRGLNMHIVTNIAGGANQYYGFFDRTAPHYRGGTHDSVDIYSGRDSETRVFAITFGEFVNYQNSRRSFGNHCIVLRFSYDSADPPNNNDGRKCFFYAHLSTRENLNNEYVRPGRIIGRTGREGNFVSYSPSHLHLQLIHDTQAAGINTYNGIAGQNHTAIEAWRLFEDFVNRDHEINRIVLPSNQLPLMLPCEGIYGTTMGTPPNDCQFNRRETVLALAGRGGNNRLGCWTIRKFPNYDFVDPRNGGEFPDPPITQDNTRMFICPYVHFKPQASISDRVLAADNSLQVDSTSQFPDSGWLLINDEVIQYPGKNANQFINVIRGTVNTTATRHEVGTEVRYLNFNDFAVQAYLKYVFTNRGIGRIPALDFLDPGAIDGSLGPLQSTELPLPINAGDAVTHVDAPDGIFIRITRGADTGWVARSLVGAIDPFTGATTILETVNSLLFFPPGSTRSAIYQYRIHLGLSMDYDRYDQNFIHYDAELVRSLTNLVVEIPIDDGLIT